MEYVFLLIVKLKLVFLIGAYDTNCSHFIVSQYFWMIKDLKRTADKPLQTTIIPEKQSKVLPLLENVANLCGESVQLPGYLLRRNKSNDPLAQSTLLAVSFRDFGYQQLASWVNPFRQQFCSSDRVEVYKLLISEGWLTRYFLRQVIQASVKSNTPVEDYRNTLLHFSSDSDVFRDPLRMHNLMSGYIFLLDGMGRVRLAGSGPASTEDVDTLIRLTNDLTLWNHNSAMKKKR
jgi:ATPase complex subunit ATP10